MSDALMSPDGLPEPPHSQNDESTTSVESDDQSPSRLKHTLKTTAWCFFGLFCLLFFTVLKLPEDRIRNFVQGMISSQLSSQGISLTSTQSSLSIGLGISYTMKDVTLNFPPPQEPVKIEQVSVSPSILSLLTGNLGAEIRVENKGGTVQASLKQPLKSAGGPIDLSFEAKNMDIGSLGLLSAMAGIKGSAIVNGQGQISGDASTPSTLVGKIQLDLTKLVIDSQAVMGFTLPKLSVSESKADISIDKGKALIKTFRLGKTGSTSDDIRGTVTGDVTLGRNLAYSTMNLTTNFSLSQNVFKISPLLEAILGMAKQPDGSFSYTITGPLNSPNPNPVTSAAPAAPAPPAGAPGQ